LASDSELHPSRSKTLFFKRWPEITDKIKLLYYKIIEGYSVVESNANEDSKIDLEQLFNCVYGKSTEKAKSNF
jgi:hypothetical protein